jgi:predicted TIM-barrel fold metal-dependent hydrolase
MIESNFPVDKVSCAYVVMMNCFKRVAARYAPDERDMILRGTAAAAYRLQI